MIKLNDTAKYVELYVEDLRTRVRSPPAPPTLKTPSFDEVFYFAVSVQRDVTSTVLALYKGSFVSIALR